MIISRPIKGMLNKHLAHGMPLIEILCFIVLVPFMLIGAFFGSALIGHWYGWLLGIIVGILTFLAFGAIWCLLKDLWSGCGLPDCRNGCCRGPGFSLEDKGDYETQVVGGEFYEVLKVCKCGDRYQKKGRRFILVNEDGSETPYFIWRPFRGWYPDKA